jgi:hypothetical protein
MIGRRSAAAPLSRWRFTTGVSLFVLGLVCPLFIPLVTATGLSATSKTFLSGALALGVPELLWLAAVAVMGKAGFDLIKGRVFGFLKRHAMPATVSRTRYRVGIVLFLLPVMVGFAQPYVSTVVEEFAAYRMRVGVAGDVLLLVSLFVLGGEFWDKVRALFVHGARVEFPAAPSTGSPTPSLSPPAGGAGEPC